MLTEEVDIEQEQIPLVITDEYFIESIQKSENFIKELRSQENYQLANRFLHIVTILENVHFQLKNEEKKAQDLLDQHVDATGRIEEAMRISQNDHDLIKKLKEEVKIAWNEADASKLREQHTSESLHVTQERYTALLTRMKLLSPNIESTDELGEHKVTVLQQCEQLNMEIEELNKRLLVQRIYSDEIQKKLEDSLQKNRDLFREWDLATNDSLLNKDKVEKLQKLLNELKDDYDKVTESLFHYKEISDMRHKRLLQREKQVIECSEKLEKFKGDNSALKVVKSKLELSLQAYKSDMLNFKLDMERFHAYVRLKEDENRKLLGKREAEAKKVENLERKITSIEKVLTQKENEITLKRNELLTVEKERDLIKKSSDDMKRENDKLYTKIEHFVREIERLNAHTSTLKQEKQKVEEEQILLNNELKFSIEREKKSRSNVKKLQANIETVEAEKQFLNESIKQLNEDAELKKKQYEAIKAELNESNEQVAHYKHEWSMSLKRLKDARSDFQRCHEKESDIKDRLVKFKSQIDDANDKLTIKLSEIVSLMKKIKRLEKRNRESKRDFERSQDTLRLCRVQLKNVDHENKLLKDEIRENNARFTKMKNQADKILRERDLIANQMYRKADENSLLEEQVSMLKMSIERGKSMYNERLDDINVLKNEIQSSRSQCNVLKRGLQNTTDMRHEVLQLHRKLNQERTKAKVLEEEITTPMNVHRWRKMNHRDPGRMELLRKYQRLQRNSLIQTTKIFKAEELIKIFQEKVTKLETELKKRSNFEAAEKLLLTRSQLNENSKRLKAAIAISRASKSDLELKGNTISHLQKEIYELKCQLFKEKQNKKKLMEELNGLKKNSAAYTDEKEVTEKLQSIGNGIKRKLLT